MHVIFSHAHGFVLFDMNSRSDADGSGPNLSSLNIGRYSCYMIPLKCETGLEGKALLSDCSLRSSDASNSVNTALRGGH